MEPQIETNVKNSQSQLTNPAVKNQRLQVDGGFKLNYWRILTIVFLILLLGTTAFLFISLKNQRGKGETNGPRLEISTTTIPKSTIISGPCMLSIEEATNLTNTQTVIDQSYGNINTGEGRDIDIAVEVPANWCVGLPQDWDTTGNPYFIDQNGQTISFSIKYLGFGEGVGLGNKTEEHKVKVLGGTEVEEIIIRDFQNKRHIMAKFELENGSQKAINKFYIDLPVEDTSTDEELINLFDKIVESARIISKEEAMKFVKERLCKDINELKQYKYCIEKEGNGQIQGPNGLIIKHITRYTISPTREWMFIESKVFPVQGEAGAPGSSALTMLDVVNDKAYELFSKILCASYIEDKVWSKSGKGVIFTVGGHSTPNIFEGTDFSGYPIVYCETSCRVLARDAKVEGMCGKPAYFEGDNVIYTNKNGDKTSIPLNH